MIRTFENFRKSISFLAQELFKQRLAAWSVLVTMSVGPRKRVLKQLLAMCFALNPRLHSIIQMNDEGMCVKEVTCLQMLNRKKRRWLSRPSRCIFETFERVKRRGSRNVRHVLRMSPPKFQELLELIEPLIIKIKI